jgi:hypothetical protein
MGGHEEDHEVKQNTDNKDGCECTQLQVFKYIWERKLTRSKQKMNAFHAARLESC